MTYTIDNITYILKGDFFQNPSPTASIEHLFVDSRNISFAHSGLFFALVTHRRNGHDFVADAYQKGVRNFIISERFHFDDFPEANFVLVEDTLDALQRLAIHHRSNFNIPVIGITGSNGKTIIKEWLFQLLNQNERIVRSPKSYNSQIGVPLSVWQMKEHHTLAIFEAGISEMNEMEKLATIIQPTIGIFTNLGTAHALGFPDAKTKLKEKAKLFESVEDLIYNADDVMVDELFEKKFAHIENKLDWCYEEGFSPLWIRKVKKIGTRTKITVEFYDEVTSIYIPFTDDNSIENAIHCWAVMLQLGYDESVIRQRMLNLKPVEMRLEVKEGINGSQIINDAYSSDLYSFRNALNFLKQKAKSGKTALIVSDFLETGFETTELYEIVAEVINESSIDRIYCIGKDIEQLKFELSGDIFYFADTDSFLQEFRLTDFNDTFVLLKGARVFEFEKIANRLSKKVHQTRLEINLSALQHNLRTYSNLLHSGTKMMVMVKAGAYGSGSVEVARVLEQTGVNYLAVAYSDEGVELRKAGVQLPIMVLNPQADTFFDLLYYNLEPEISNWDMLVEFNRFMENKKQQANFSTPAGLPPVFDNLMEMIWSQNIPFQEVKVHIKLDTGMHRLGFVPDELPLLIDFFENDKFYRIGSILSHLAASEDPQHDDFTMEQIDLFIKMYQKITDAIGYYPTRHILNSSGIIRFPEYQMDMVRLGIGLYGIDSSNRIQEDLMTVNSLKATVSQIKNIKKGDTVSYGRSGVAQCDMTIATLSIGYADGLMRAAGNGNYQVVINGQRVPIFGTVCMDMCMVDITDIGAVRQGDEVLIFGESPTVNDLATAVGTIPYEIFTGVSSRVKRVYYWE